MIKRLNNKDRILRDSVINDNIYYRDRFGVFKDKKILWRE